MTLELRNRLEASLGLKLSATVVWSYPTLTALAEHLAKRLDLGADAERADAVAPTGAAAAPAPSPAPVGNVEELSDDEAAALLAARLSELQERSAR
jgi:hypothetical protein